MDCALKAMGAAVTAWSEAEAEKAEKEETEAEIIKYKMQEHVVCSFSQRPPLYDFHTCRRDV